jgi:hypothetical protein
MPDRDYTGAAMDAHLSVILLNATTQNRQPLRLGAHNGIAPVSLACLVPDEGFQ